jgi:hypothetical protein
VNISVREQVLSNAGVHQATGRKPAKPSQAARATTGGVSELRVSRHGGREHCLGYDSRLVCLLDQLRHPLA